MFTLYEPFLVHLECSRCGAPPVWEIRGVQNQPRGLFCEDHADEALQLERERAHAAYPNGIFGGPGVERRSSGLANGRTAS